MRYLFGVIDSTTGSATSAEISDIDAFNERLVDGGHWVMAFGLSSPREASVIDGRGAMPTVTAGPLIDSLDYISGIWIIEAPDHDTATALAIEASRCCRRRVELRPFFAT